MSRVLHAMPRSLRAGRALLALAALLALVGSPAPGADQLPALPLPAQRLECHGTLDGEPFWARLLPPDAQFGGNRMLQLVYAPPKPEAIAGAHLVDCPFLLLDEHARLVAWNGRDGLSQVLPGAKDSYQVSRELLQGEGEAAKSEVDKRVVKGRGFDLHLAPLLLALCWSESAPVSVPVVDLFGARSGEALTCSWKDGHADIAGEPFTVVAEHGRFRRLVAADGTSRIEVAAWLPAATP